MRCERVAKDLQHIVKVLQNFCNALQIANFTILEIFANFAIIAKVLNFAKFATFVKFAIFAMGCKEVASVAKKLQWVAKKL